MKKINGDVLKACNETTCLGNELVVLPQNGDVGFDEYVDYKTNQIIKAKNLSPYTQNKLMLEYPSPDAKEHMIFERFFESPFVVAYNRDFEGCFAIDVSAYIGKYNDVHFTNLISYMLQNKAAVYTLILYTNNKNEIKAMYDAVSQYMDLQLTHIPLPEPAVLADYTVEEIRAFSLHVSASVNDFLQEYYEKNPAGYDKADYIVRYLKNANYSGDLKSIKKLFAELTNGKTNGNVAVGFGY